MGDLNTTLTNINTGLGTATALVGSVAALVAGIGAAIRRRQDAGENVDDFVSALARFDRALATVRDRDVAYQALPAAPRPEDMAMSGPDGEP